MHVARDVVGLVVVAAIAAGCGASGSAAPTSPPTPAAVAGTTAPTTAATAVPTAAPTPTPTSRATATPAPTREGPVTLTSTQFPYELTAPSGPTSFVPAPAPWDGIGSLGTDTRVADRARVSGIVLWLAMTDTADPVDAVAADIDAKFQRWHACSAATGRREFTVGKLRGVAFGQRCGGGEAFVRAVLVGGGHMLVTFSPAGLDTAASLDRLIDVLGGVAFVDR